MLNDAENVEGAGGGEEEAATPPAGSGANVTGIDQILKVHYKIKQRILIMVMKREKLIL